MLSPSGPKMCYRLIYLGKNKKSCQYEFKLFVKNCQMTDKDTVWTNVPDQLIRSSQHRCYRCTRFFFFFFYKERHCASVEHCIHLRLMKTQHFLPLQLHIKNMWRRSGCWLLFLSRLATGNAKRWVSLAFVDIGSLLHRPGNITMQSLGIRNRKQLLAMVAHLQFLSDITNY